MKLCKVENIKGEEILARTIMTDGYQVLLSEGTKMKPEYIERLKDLGITEIFVEDDKADENSIVILKEEVEEKFKEKVKELIEKHTYNGNEDLVEIRNTADHIISNILEEEKVIELVYDIKERNADIYLHSISICSLATIVALRLGLSKEQLHDIGVGCLLHDLGLRYIMGNYENREINMLPENEIIEYKKHPVYGYSALKKEDWISKTSKEIILYHHERLDGSGYPLHIEEIPIESRIVNVCDAFDEMICGIGCVRTKVYEAVEYLKTFKNMKFDAKIVDAFLQFTAVFPSGSIVMTNEGEVGIVVKQNKHFPERPVIRIIQGKDGVLEQGEVIKDLLQINNIYIDRVID